MRYYEEYAYGVCLNNEEHYGKLCETCGACLRCCACEWREADRKKRYEKLRARLIKKAASRESE